MLHVGPYLMGSACLEDALHEGNIPETFKHPIMGDGGFTHFAVWRKHCHAKPIAWIAPDVTLYASLVFCEIGPHQGVIAAVSGFVEELQTQLSLGFGCLRHHQQSACIFIYTVNQPHFWVISVERRHVAQMPSHSIDERSVEVSRTRMHHHTRRFIDNHQRFVFVHHVKWYLFGLDSCVVVRTIKHQRNHIARSHLVIALYRTLVYMHKARIGCLLYAVAARMLQPLGHKSVDTHRHLALVYHDAQMLVELPRVVILFFYLFCIVGHALLLLLMCALRAW